MRETSEKCPQEYVEHDEHGDEHDDDVVSVDDGGWDRPPRFWSAWMDIAL